MGSKNSGVKPLEYPLVFISRCRRFSVVLKCVYPAVGADQVLGLKSACNQLLDDAGGGGTAGAEATRYGPRI